MAAASFSGCRSCVFFKWKASKRGLNIEEDKKAENEDDKNSSMQVASKNRRRGYEDAKRIYEDHRELMESLRDK